MMEAAHQDQGCVRIDFLDYFFFHIRTVLAFGRDTAYKL